MPDEMITTGVDDLIAYLRDKDRVAMQDTATILNIPLETIQAWVDFLVEEKILGVEYKFTKPFIYLNREDPSKSQRAKLLDRTLPIEQIKQEFEEHAKQKQIPASKIAELWHSHVVDALTRKREFFFEQAARHHLPDPERLWQQYQADLLGRC